MKTPVKQKESLKAGLKAKAKEIVANTNKSAASKVMAGLAAKVAAKKEAKAATTPAPMQKRKFGDMAKAKVAAKKEAKAATTKPAPDTKPATTPAPMQKYGMAKGKPAAKMKKC